MLKIASKIFLFITFSYLNCIATEVVVIDSHGKAESLTININPTQFDPINTKKPFKAIFINPNEITIQEYTIDEYGNPSMNVTIYNKFSSKSIEQ